jgi:hypothetical protein
MMPENNGDNRKEQDDLSSSPSWFICFQRMRNTLRHAVLFLSIAIFDPARSSVPSNSFMGYITIRKRISQMLEFARQFNRVDAIASTDANW